MSAKVLGSGTFGVVRREGDSAIKQFNSDYDNAEDGSCILCHSREYLWEVQCLTNIVSPYVVKVKNVRLETSEVELELMDGTLHDLVKKKKTTLRVILQAFWQIATAIRDTNAAGYIHRDVKPANILYKVNANGEYIFKLCDFSAATAINNINESDYTTRPFAAPEMLLTRNYNEKVDVWSLAMTILWCFDKKFAGDDIKTCLKTFFGAFGVPSSLEQAGEDSKKHGAPSFERNVKYVRACMKAFGVKKYPRGLTRLLVGMTSIDQHSRMDIHSVVRNEIFDEFLDYDSDSGSPSPSSPWTPYYDWTGKMKFGHRLKLIEMVGEFTRCSKVLIHTFDIFDRIAKYIPKEDSQEYLMACYDLVIRFLWSTPTTTFKSIKKLYSKDIENDVRKLQPWILQKIKYQCYRTTYHEINGGVVIDWAGLVNILMDLNKLYLRNSKISEW
nr:putative kinase [Kaumoebavirus]